MSQLEFPIIRHEIEQSPINQRAIDGYINATEMCKVAGKPFAQYSLLKSTKAYLKALSSDVGIPTSELVQTIKGGIPEFQGTWVHPEIAIDLAKWLSPQFAVKVNRWVFEWLSGRAKQPMPDHVRRYVINQHKIPHTHFSMLNQMVFRVLGPLEAQGYILPHKMMIDISMGKIFSQWCRKNGHDPESFPTYPHEFLPGDNRPIVQARLYPNSLMTSFNAELDTWLRDGRAEKYFRKRDPTAIEALNKILALPPPKHKLK